MSTNKRNQPKTTDAKTNKDLNAKGKTSVDNIEEKKTSDSKIVGNKADVNVADTEKSDKDNASDEEKLKNENNESIKWGVTILLTLSTLILSIASFNSNYNLDKSNSTLVLKFQDFDYDNDNSIVKLHFSREQGQISKAFKITRSDNGEYIYTQIKDWESNHNGFTVDINLSDTEIAEDSEYASISDSFMVPALKSCVLAVYDYKGVLSTYYVVVRPNPRPNDVHYAVHFTFTSEFLSVNPYEFDIDAKNAENWGFEVALIDCTYINAASVKNTLLSEFNDDDEMNGTFTFDEERGIFVSEFLLFSKNQNLKGTLLEGNEHESDVLEDILKQSITVSHYSYDVESDLAMIDDIVSKDKEDS